MSKQREKVVRLECRLAAWQAFARRQIERRQIAASGSEAADKILSLARERDELKRLVRERKKTRRDVFKETYLPNIKALSEKNKRLQNELNEQRARLAQLETLAGCMSETAVLAIIDVADCVGGMSPSVVCTVCIPKRG